ncbi:hypothetical protein [Robbsia sp. KACC 23696]|uniref:hypothetical protein n=1 Tax=Robbsia sp. KACC 23696 TaxID=3149231 RepID=UPI00325B645B
MPPDIWRLIITHLPASEAMALRATAHAAQGPLKIVSDALLDGCRMIDCLTKKEGADTMPRFVVIGKLGSLPLEARSDILKRYARDVGMAYYVETGRLETNKLAFLSSLKNRYFKRRSAQPDSEKGKSTHCWSHVVRITETALLEATFDSSSSIALMNLYAAEMYAPLLGVVSDPEAHIKRVMDHAAMHLTMLRWMDFLYALEPIKDVCAIVTGAFQTLARDMDRRYPTPSIDVLAAIVHASMTMIRHSEPVKNLCLHRMGIEARCVAEKITPRLTQCITDAILFDPFVRGIDVPYRLSRLLARWGDDDGIFAASLHQSFVTSVARKRYRGATRWKSLPDAVRFALCSNVLNIAPDNSVAYGLNGRTIIDFWGLYFEVTGPNTRLMLPKVTARIDALPWPLRATLWRLAADIHAYPENGFRGYAHPVSRVLSAERIDTLCMQALDSGVPHFAIPALQATLRWQVSQDCRELSHCRQAPEVTPYGESTMGIPCCPVFPQSAWAVFERCSIAERLPFIAALFSYRALLMDGDGNWPYETLVSSNVGGYMCNPTSSLIRPSRVLVDVLLHYAPQFRAHLPEYLFDSDGWERAFVKRFDLMVAD